MHTHICLYMYTYDPVFGGGFFFQRSQVYSFNFIFLKSSNSVCYRLEFIMRNFVLYPVKWFRFWTTKLVLPIRWWIAWPLRFVDDDKTVLLPIFKIFMEDEKVLNVEPH